MGVWGTSRQYGLLGSRFFAPGSKFNWSEHTGSIYDNSVVSLSINWIARNWPDSPMIIEEESAEGWKPVRHDLTRIVTYGNPWYDDSVLWFGFALSMVAAGNAYWMVLQDRIGRPAGFVYVPHFQVKPVRNDNEKGLVSFYEVTPVGGGLPVPVPVDRIIHFRWGQDPMNPMMGMSPLYAIYREIAAVNLASTFEVALLRNFGVPGLMFIPEEPQREGKGPTPEQKEGVRQILRDTFSIDGAGRMAVMPIKGKLESPAMSPQELALESLRTVPASRILGALGLDNMVLNLESDSRTYSNMGVAKEMSYEGCMIPMKRIAASALTRQVLMPAFGETTKRVGWDFSDTRALQEDQEKLWKRVVDAYAKGAIKRKEAKTLLKQPVDDTADDVYIQDVTQGLDAQKSALKREIAGKAEARRRAIQELGLADDVVDDSESDG